LAPILISFSRSVVNDQCFTDLGSADRRVELDSVDRLDLE
jgi:hypothetical protein